MPFLKFRCKECGKVFDELVPISRMDEVKCPSCKGGAERAYEGKCACSPSGGECAHNCASCHGCGK